MQLIDALKQTLWSNYGSAIDMLTNVVSLLPDAYWEKDRKFFYRVYHTTIFLDYYLSFPVHSFQPLLPYTVVPPDKIPPEAMDDVLPNRLYSKREVLAYLAIIRAKAKLSIKESTESTLNSQWITEEEIGMHDLCPSLARTFTVLEILFYNLRHVQHHVGQLNGSLRQMTNQAASWVAQVEPL